MKKICKRLAIYVIVAVLAFSWQFYGVKNIMPLLSFDNAISDFVYYRPKGTKLDIKIIGIDEETLACYGRYEDWSREKTAQLIELLSKDDKSVPAVIGLDILFVGESQGAAEADERLALACKNAGNVVAASNLVYRIAIEHSSGGGYYYDEWNIEDVELPYSGLGKAVTSGFANAMQDRDGYIRRARLLAYCDGRLCESFSLKIANEYLKGKNERLIVPDSNMVKFMFSGAIGEYEKVSFCDVLEGKVDLKTFRDSIVLIGAYAPGMQDAYNVAAERGGQMYGVEIHANVIEALINNKIVKDVPLYMAAAAVTCMLLLYIFVARKQKLLMILTEGFLFMGVWLIAGIVLKGYGWLLPLSVAEFGTLFLMIYFVITGYFKEKLGKKRMLKAFERYVAPQVVKELGKQDSFEARLGGERRDIAVLFVDIRGFTTMSEVLMPEQVVEILNEYLELTSHAIFKNHGMLDKFIGDATMAVFNAPVDLEDYVFFAVKAAYDMRKGAEALEKRLMEQFGRSVQFGIGINCGPAIVGNIGCERRMDYTAIGDTVNTAARLEGIAGKGEILLSSEVYEAVKDRVEVQPAGELLLKGKEQRINAYRLLRIL